ncbi:hypothetical protein AYI68_g73 [Smittium mucronatum]|uniref:Uncharacterized protein n=1 Tax=Smittium mucronatum TaxID=133383 RepID=A0A1R0H985_9FUNG|nr:hypothetical protein AYI68_g73 [Smittium mucronatum]
MEDAILEDSLHIDENIKSDSPLIFSPIDPSIPLNTNDFRNVQNNQFFPHQVSNLDISNGPYETNSFIFNPNQDGTVNSTNSFNNCFLANSFDFQNEPHNRVHSSSPHTHKSNSDDDLNPILLNNDEITFTGQDFDVWLKTHASLENDVYRNTETPHLIQNPQNSVNPISSHSDSLKEAYPFSGENKSNQYNSQQQDAFSNNSESYSDEERTPSSDFYSQSNHSLDPDDFIELSSSDSENHDLHSKPDSFAEKNSNLPEFTRFSDSLVSDHFENYVYSESCSQNSFDSDWETDYESSKPSQSPLKDSSNTFNFFKPHTSSHSDPLAEISLQSSELIVESTTNDPISAITYKNENSLNESQSNINLSCNYHAQIEKNSPASSCIKNVPETFKSNIQIPDLKTLPKKNSSIVSIQCVTKISQPLENLNTTTDTNPNTFTTIDDVSALMSSTPAEQEFQPAKTTKKIVNGTHLPKIITDKPAPELPPSNHLLIGSKSNLVPESHIVNELFNRKEILLLIKYLTNFCNKADIFVDEVVELSNLTNKSSASIQNSEDLIGDEFIQHSTTNLIESSNIISSKKNNSKLSHKDSPYDFDIESSHLNNIKGNDEKHNLVTNTNHSIIPDYNHREIKVKKTTDRDHNWEVLNRELSFLRKSISSTNNELLDIKSQRDSFIKKSSELESSNSKLISENKNLKSQLIIIRSQVSSLKSQLLKNGNNSRSVLRKSLGLFDDIYNIKTENSNDSNQVPKLGQQESGITSYNYSTDDVSKDSRISDNYNSTPASNPQEPRFKFSGNIRGSHTSHFSFSNNFNIPRKDSKLNGYDSPSLSFKNNNNFHPSSAEAFGNLRLKKGLEDFQPDPKIGNINHKANIIPTPSSNHRMISPNNYMNRNGYTPQNLSIYQTSTGINNRFESPYLKTPNFRSSLLNNSNLNFSGSDKRKHVSTPKINTQLLSKKKKI